MLRMFDNARKAIRRHAEFNALSDPVAKQLYKDFQYYCGVKGYRQGRLEELADWLRWRHGPEFCNSVDDVWMRLAEIGVPIAFGDSEPVPPSLFADIARRTNGMSHNEMRSVDEVLGQIDTVERQIREDAERDSWRGR